MPDFDNLLDAPVGDFKPPITVPPGHYKLRVDKHEMVKSGKKGTPGVRFHFNIVSALDDVDADDLAQVKDIQKKNLREDFWLVEDAMFRLNDFFKACGLETEGKSTRRLLSDAVGNYVIGNVVNELPRDAKPTALGEAPRKFAVIKGFVAAGD